jgi:hypothetical protein
MAGTNGTNGTNGHTERPNVTEQFATPAARTQFSDLDDKTIAKPKDLV